ncbi:MAG: Malonyl CoA-acyl carrier protein transacylase [Alphaproteobacteria bacterium MarineAlpha5_Bin8]|nr:MAG: Malonyl CoA-acyl carrier protein transacylase [Alphaproteobacteria bacterium MarineAlpha5_Bin7]PPR46427.1 MAG: Malonyl CoA-acyl carrier protein transacylase [Alphaproteobacteria bacterium MarineAlpha5_Bin8]PPR53329.1 MAG: Malonyl CoA-acyl carrier protein transacylase [Alphaproteobacteria bacterium MarineAlpha5_Bin6]|tara:strand:- start:21 stop:950 length:930 start_codon:yes stop_codon:yes gene_type:complete
MTAIVFPGQGSQFVGMVKDFYDNFSEAREVFQEVEDSAKISIKDIIFENKSNLLDITQYTQISIFCASISIFNVLKKKYGLENFSIEYTLGHSLGEYTALVASEVLTISECSKLLKSRGELMHNSYSENKSGMSAVIGIECAKLEKIIELNNLNIEIANDNSPQQVVISGIKEDLINSEKKLMENGAKKIVNLNVSAAFHSKIMIDAEKEMKNNLNKINFKNPIYSVISNYSGKNSKESSILFDNLSKQMSNKVRWVDSIKTLEKLGETSIIEIGPGKVLTGLIKRISNNFKIKNINIKEDLENIINEI